MKLVAGAESSFEWESRQLDSHVYTCPLKLVLNLDPEMSVNATYVFSLADLTILKDLLVTTVADVKGWSATPVVHRTPSPGTPPLPVQADLDYLFDGPEALEPAPTPSLREKVNCPMCPSQIGLRKLRLHVGGHILEDKVRHVYTQ